MSELFTRGGSKVEAGDIIQPADSKGAGIYRAIKHCGRCGGLGGGEQWRHTGWTCFDCGGRGKWPEPRVCYTAERLAKLNATAEKKLANANAKREAAQAAHLAEKRAGYQAWVAENVQAVSEIAAHAALSSFLSELYAKLRAGQVLTDGQVGWAVHSIVKHYAEDDAKAATTYIGKVGERVNVTFTVERCMDYSDYNSFPRRYYFITIGTTADGNTVVYKGSVGFKKGDEVVAKWTVKDHEERQGVKQTILARPTWPKEAIAA